MNEYLERLAELLATTAGPGLEAPELTAAEAEEILALAGAVAHSSERRFAPLAAYLAGAAVERARAAGGAIDTAAYLKAVRERLEPPAGDTAK